MKSMFYSTALACLAAVFSGCAANNEAASQPEESQVGTNDSLAIRGDSCTIKLENVHFTQAINGADTLAVVQGPGKIKFSVGEKKDFFNDPDGKLSNNTAPVLLSVVDNTKPFTLTAKVTPEFTPTGLYSAGVLYLYVNDSLYHKFCFEQDERGKHRVVTVRTRGTSDDNNHDIVTQPYIYMKISSDTKTVASYYSLDNKNWQMVRLYKNDYPGKIGVGISAQSPVDKSSVSYFEDLKLESSSVKDFRMGN
ncbi:DUF1349 domain-containing protein [Paraflavisolibacter sp. H34]|uniref:DUF1349 domain-containing protein n=1 Tax=Huijunlia imazamoxiresistens TaxID=3127457 RepID=UPI003016A46D